MGLSIGGSKGKSKSSSTESFNQTQTNTLSDRAVNALTGSMGRIGGLSYQGVTPEGVAAFKNPYDQDVIDATLARLNHEGAIARNQQNADFAKAGAFGDKRRGVYQAELEAGMDRNRAEVIGGMNAAAYDKALAAASADAQARNQYALSIEALLAQLAGGFANEGTTRSSGTSTGTQKGKTSGLNFGWSSQG